jgi:hypothetical protein
MVSVDKWFGISTIIYYCLQGINIFFTQVCVGILSEKEPNIEVNYTNLFFFFNFTSDGSLFIYAS